MSANMDHDEHRPASPPAQNHKISLPSTFGRHGQPALGFTEQSFRGYLLFRSNHHWSSLGFTSESHSAAPGRARAQRHLDTGIPHPQRILCCITDLLMVTFIPDDIGYEDFCSAMDRIQRHLQVLYISNYNMDETCTQIPTDGAGKLGR